MDTYHIFLNHTVNEISVVGLPNLSRQTAEFVSISVHLRSQISAE